MCIHAHPHYVRSMSSGHRAWSNAIHLYFQQCILTQMTCKPPCIDLVIHLVQHFIRGTYCHTCACAAANCRLCLCVSMSRSCRTAASSCCNISNTPQACDLCAPVVSCLLLGSSQQRALSSRGIAACRAVAGAVTLDVGIGGCPMSEAKNVTRCSACVHKFAKVQNTVTGRSASQKSFS